MANRKTHIFLAGDSTVQSYTSDMYPQTGWGQVLCRYFKGYSSVRSYPSVNCPFPQATCYELENLVIDNRAMAGRSTRSFLDEGRLEDIDQAIQPGDFMLMQFGHNDAYFEKKERYVSPDEFPDFLAKYISVCTKHQATAVLVTPIAMRNCDDNPKGDFTFSFPEYRNAMIQYHTDTKIPLLDLGKATTEYCRSLGSEGCKSIFMWIKPGEYPDGPHKEGKEDNAHLKEKGAIAFAGILAGLIRSYSDDDRLDVLKDNLTDSIEW